MEKKSKISKNEIINDNLIKTYKLFLKKNYEFFQQLRLNEKETLMQMVKTSEFIPNNFLNELRVLPLQMQNQKFSVLENNIKTLNNKLKKMNILFRKVSIMAFESSESSLLMSLILDKIVEVESRVVALLRKMQKLKRIRENIQYIICNKNVIHRFIQMVNFDI